MIVLDVKANNLYSFNDFSINFSYPKKIVKSNIGDECLSYCPSFRYKKFVLLMGANATGKTTLGKLIMSISNFIVRREYNAITSIINDKNSKASFSIDLISEDRIFHHIETTVDKISNNDYKSNDIHTKVYSTPIKDRDNYERCLKRINKEINENNNQDDYIKELEKIGNISWMFKFANFDYINKANIIDSNSFLNILNRTLKILDPRILGVEKVPNTNDSFVIRYKYRNVMINEGEISLNKDDTLSSGTKEGIGIAHLIASIKHGGYKFFYCDEKFSHVHSDTEAAFISLMISCLKEDTQLIMTSHNTELLEINLPKHSYAFLKRDENTMKVSSMYASDYLKRNTDSIKCAVDNDIFGTSPDVSEIYKLKEL